MKTANSEQSEVSSQPADSRPMTIGFRLYVITDRKILSPPSSLLTAVEEALKGGVKAVQLREKDLGTREALDMAYKMREVCKAYNAKLYVNDRVDIALAVGADGVHLGQKSIPAHVVKKTFRDRFIIGVSTHNLDEALEAERGGADFITLGPIYHTPSKIKYGEPIGIDSLSRVKAQISIPVFAIGGITLDKVGEVKGAGADGVALISAILTAESIRGATEEFLRLLK